MILFFFLFSSSYHRCVKVTSGTFLEFQRLNTIHAWDVEVIQFGGRTFLAVGTGKHHTSKLESPIFEFCSASNMFALFQNIRTNSAIDFESFELSGTGEQYLAIGNKYCSPQADSNILTLNHPTLLACMTLLKFDEATDRFVEFQRFIGFDVRDVEYAAVNGKSYLFVAHHGGYELDAESYIYKRNVDTGFYALHQTVYGSSPNDFEVWSIGSRHYMMLVNSHEDCGLEQHSTLFSGPTCTDVDNILYEYEKVSEKYVDVQKLPTKMGYGVKHFTMGAMHLVASTGFNQHHVAVYSLGSFTPTQAVPPHHCRGALAISSGTTNPISAKLSNVSIENALCIASKCSSDTIALIDSSFGHVAADVVSSGRISYIQPTPTERRTWVVDAIHGNDNAVNSKLMQTIQAGVNAAKNGDSVLLKKGVFTSTASCRCEHTDPNKRQCNHNIDVQGKSIVVKGEGPLASDVVVDCGLSSSWPTSWTDHPARAFVFHSGETNATVLQMLSIRNCRSHPGVTLNSCQAGSVMANSLTFSFSRGPFPNVPAHAGGAIAVVGAAFPMLIDLVVENSHAGMGGGLFLGTDSGATLIRVNVHNCSGGGGAAVALLRTDQRTRWLGGTIKDNVVDTSNNVGAYESCNNNHGDWRNVALNNAQRSPGGLQQSLLTNGAVAFTDFYKSNYHYLIACSRNTAAGWDEHNRRYHDETKNVNVYRRHVDHDQSYTLVQEFNVPNCCGVDEVDMSGDIFVAFVGVRSIPAVGGVYLTHSPVYQAKGPDSAPLELVQTVPTNGASYHGVDTHKFDGKLFCDLLLLHYFVVDKIFAVVKALY